MLNQTHDPAARSWLPSANQAGCEFPIQNLPFGVFRSASANGAFRCGVAIGSDIVDLTLLASKSVVSGLAARALAACGGSDLTPFFALGKAAWSALRLALFEVLREGSPHADAVRTCLAPQADAHYALPARIGDYTDFYTSIYHATAIGKMFRPDNPLLPNYKWVPIGYHGRSSTIGVSGQQFPRPVGQTLAPGAGAPEVGPCKRMDYELEMGVFIGRGNSAGTRVPITEAEDHVFGLCLLNDWSARDIQAWEYQPLGPFLAKNFATTISPWIVTLEALAPYRTAWTRPAGDPQPLPYLDSPDTRASGAIDIELEVWLETARMRSEQAAPVRLSGTSLRHAYWTIAQMVTHHTINGCALASGDLLGTGTESGPRPEEAGSMTELTSGGKNPLTLPNGERRGFLEDGDAVILRAYCDKPGAVRIGFGECRGTLLPALA